MQLFRFFKTTSIAIAALLAGLSGWSQNITNPSFETSNTCPTSNSQFRNNVTSWQVSLGATAGSPDYFKRCGYSITGADYGGISAQNGDGFAGGYVEMNNSPSYTDYKEYITNTLSTPLVAGVTYTFSFYTAHLYGTSTPATGLVPGITYADLPVAEQGFLGAVFSTAAPGAANTVGNTSPRFNSIKNDFGLGRALVPATNTAVYGAASRNNWVQVTLQYTAVGGEQYMTIGQFRPGGTSLPAMVGAYYLFDNFSEALTVLPVNFGNIQATMTDNQLHVNWQTLQEANNDHFDIEASVDGAHFTRIGSVTSLAANGQSDSSISYSFSKSVDGLSLGLGLLVMVMGLGLSNRKKIWTVLLVGLGCCTVLYSCSKNTRDSIGNAEGKLFIRVAQVDKDETTTYSKTVTVVNK